MSGILDIVKSVGLKNLISQGRSRRTVWEALIGPHVVLRCAQTALHVGLLDAMKSGAVDVLEFAERQDLDGRLLVGICELLTARGVLKQEGRSTFKLGKLGRRIAEADMARGWCELAYGYERVLYHMEDLVTKKTYYGNGVSRNGLHVAIGSGLTSQAFFFPIVIEIIRRRGYKHVVDLGCGDGTFLRVLASKIPGIRGSGIDLSPDAVDEGNERMREQGLADRLRLYAGNLVDLEAHPEAINGADTATSFFVLHELSKRDDHQETIEFLGRFRSVLPGKDLIIVEPDRPSVSEMTKRPGPAIEYYLFHDLSGQRTLPRRTWKALLTRAGFEQVVEERIRLARTSIFIAS